MQIKNVNSKFRNSDRCKCYYLPSSRRFAFFAEGQAPTLLIIASVITNLESILLNERLAVLKTNFYEMEIFVFNYELCNRLNQRICSLQL